MRAYLAHNPLKENPLLATLVFHTSAPIHYLADSCATSMTWPEISRPETCSTVVVGIQPSMLTLSDVIGDDKFSVARRISRRTHVFDPSSLHLYQCFYCENLTWALEPGAGFGYAVSSESGAFIVDRGPEPYSRSRCCIRMITRARDM